MRKNSPSFVVCCRESPEQRRMFVFRAQRLSFHSSPPPRENSPRASRTPPSHSRYIEKPYVILCITRTVKHTLTAKRTSMYIYIYYKSLERCTLQRVKNTICRIFRAVQVGIILWREQHGTTTSVDSRRAAASLRRAVRQL